MTEKEAWEKYDKNLKEKARKREENKIHYCPHCGRELNPEISIDTLGICPRCGTAIFKSEESEIMILNHSINKLKREIKRLVTLRDTMRRKYDNAIKCGGVHSTPTGDLSHSSNKLRGKGS